MAIHRLTDVVKAYDVRGLVGEELNESVCAALGSAFAQVIAIPEGADRLAIGHDMRPSSPVLAAAFAAGAARHGVGIVHVGLTSTDGLYYTSGSRDLPGAMFTASHNPAQYNGIKLCRSGARPVGTGTGLDEVRDLAQWLLDRGEGHAAFTPPAVDAGAGAQPQAYDPTGAFDHQDITQEYAQFLRSLVDLSSIRDLRVVIDAGNGMAGLTAPAVFDPVRQLSTSGLYLDLDGTFPNHPANPLDPDTLIDLQAAVIREGADLGLAFDGDADRCAVIDERGQIVSASAVTALIAEREITRARGRESDDLNGEGTDPAEQITVVHNLICSRAVPERIRAAGATPVRTRVGHSYIKAEMARHGAVFGGEHSAHYYFRDFWNADTGMLAALHLLAAVGGQSGTVSELMRAYDPYAASGELNSTVAPSDRPAVIAAARSWGESAGAVADDLDGLTLTWDDPAGGAAFWSVNLRASNTEPLLRLNVEAHDQETMTSIRDHVLGMVRR